MAEVLTRPLLRREEPAWGSRVPWLAALLGSVWTLAAGFAICVLPAMAWWIGDVSNGSIADPLRFGSWTWLVAHRAAVETSGSAFTLPPLGITILIGLLMYHSARWSAHAAGVSSNRGAAAVIIPSVAAYATGGGIIAMMSASGATSVSIFDAVLSPGLWALVVTSLAVVHEADLIDPLLQRLPQEVRAALNGGAAAVAALVAVGAVLVAIAVAAGAGQIGAVAEALDGGGLGSTVLLLGCVAFAPNAVVWGAAFALGPGFAMGSDTAVAPTGIDLGLVPALPLLGALPTSVSSVAWVVVAGPMIAGALAGLVVHRRLGENMTVPPVAVAAGGSGAVAMIGMAMAAMLSGGSAGDGRMAIVGPIPGQVALTTLLLIGVPAAGTAVLLRTMLGARAEGAATE